MSAAKKTRAPAPPARKGPVIPAVTVNDTIAAISLVDVVLHSMESQEIGAPQQVVLKLALAKLWAVHDVLIEIAPAVDDDDDEGAS